MWQVLYKHLTGYVLKNPYELSTIIHTSRWENWVTELRNLVKLMAESPLVPGGLDPEPVFSTMLPGKRERFSVNEVGTMAIALVGFFWAGYW